MLKFKSDEEECAFFFSLEEKLKCEKSLYEFLKFAWKSIEGDVPFFDSWHLEAISLHLEACYRREIKNLLINIPPRSSKTSLISICFPVWCWILDPSLKFIYASYAKSLSLEHALKSRRLIESEWFQNHWGDKFKLRSDQNTKGFFENDQKGYRMSTSVGASVTGSGGNFLVCLPYECLVTTSQGELPIGKIVEEKINCKILSFNHKNNVIEFKEIEEFEKNPGKEILEIEFVDGTILECTEDHPVFVEKKGYIEAREILNSDICLSFLERKIVKIIRRKKVIPDYVFNLRIKDNRNYFANTILVHNCDDPESTRTSQTLRTSTALWFDQTFSTRLNNPKQDVKILVQQRVHEKDLSGHIIARDTAEQWVKLILPMEFESASRSKTVVLPSSAPNIWEDPRQKEGSLLIPERFGGFEILKLKTALGEFGYANQFQQRPAPLEGGILKRNWFKLYQGNSLPIISLVLQSWDCAFSDKPTAAFSACTTWGLFESKGIVNLLLLSCWRGRVNYPELRKRATRLYQNYLDRETDSKITSGLPVNRCIIEEKATGSPLIYDLRATGMPAVAYQPRGDKEARVQQISAYIEAGIVHYLDKPENMEFINEVATFPNSESLDYADTLSQILAYLRDNNMLTVPKDPEPFVTKVGNAIGYFQKPN